MGKCILCLEVGSSFDVTGKPESTAYSTIANCSPLVSSGTVSYILHHLDTVPEEM